MALYCLSLADKLPMNKISYKISAVQEIHRYNQLFTSELVALCVRKALEGSAHSWSRQVVLTSKTRSSEQQKNGYKVSISKIQNFFELSV